MLVRELVQILETIAPTLYAEPWDNTGLLTGDPSNDVRSVLLTIDYTQDVAAEAIQLGVNFVIAYHPPIFEGLKKIPVHHVVYDAVQRSIAIYSPHTALDIAEGGTNDVLAEALGLQTRVPLRISQAKEAHLKLVVFVPATHIEHVSSALFEAGAGHIGHYSSCSFRSVGVGTFFGQEQANPVIGSKLKFEQVEEIRLETIVPIACLTRVIQALRKTHPYEEPAFDLIRLAPEPKARGLGRFGEIEPTARDILFKRIKSALHLNHLLIAGPIEGNITRVAVGAGACGDLINDALSKKAELYLTGELRHHDALKAAAMGMTVVCTLHSCSERASLISLKNRLLEYAPALDIYISKADRDPFQVR